MQILIAIMKIHMVILLLIQYLAQRPLQRKNMHLTRYVNMVPYGILMNIMRIFTEFVLKFGY